MTGDINNHFPLLSPAEVGSGQYAGVFIDDTGTPGHDSPTIHLHKNRRTWVAVVLTHEHLLEAYHQMPRALEELKQSFNLREFHFSDLLSGKGIRSIPYDDRLGIFRFMALIFSVYRYPVLVQTFSPDHLAEHQHSLSSGASLGPFKLSDPGDLSLLFLLFRIRRYFAEHQSKFPRPPLVFMDEGRFAARTAVSLESLLDYAAFRALFVRSSMDMFSLQLADFAAFTVNRTQWLLAKNDRTDKDNDLLQILSEARLNVINLPTVTVDIANWTPGDYETFLIKDRIAKGLPSLPGDNRPPQRDDP